MSAAAGPVPPPESTSAGPGGTRALHAAWRTHRGNFRRNNEDHVLLVPLGTAPHQPPADAGRGTLSTAGRGTLGLVCDGVGGGAAGEVASALAASVFLRTLDWQTDPAATSSTPAAVDVATADAAACRAWLGHAVEAAHREILATSARDRALEGMGTTLTAAWFVGRHVHLAQVGDSRLYRLRGGQLTQLSADQSFVGRLRRSGALSERAARRHPLRNIVDQVVGGSEQGVVPELHTWELAAGDEYLLCSDGLSDSLDDLSVARVLVEGQRAPVDTVTAELLERVLQSAGRDNVTLLQLRVGPARASLLGTWIARLRLAWHARQLAAAEARAADSDPPFPSSTEDSAPPAPPPPAER